MKYFLYAIVALTACIGAAFLLRLWLYNLVDRRIARFQSDLIKKHSDEVQNMYREMRGWRHDYHNHIQAMKAYLAMGQYGQIGEHLSKLDADLTTVDTVLKTGNVMVDAILNSKLSLARSRQINVNAKAVVPEAVTISEVDLCVIIGNLLDNAMEACDRLSDEADRSMRVYIDVKKRQLYISVTNSADAAAIRGFVSTKQGGYHGFGLMRVDRVVGKYNGYIKRGSEAGAFTTEVLLPI